MAPRAAPARHRRAALVAGDQARRSPRILLSPDGVLRPRARAHAGRESGRGHRPRQRHAVRAHERDPVARRPRGRPLGRAHPGRQPVRQSADHRGHRRAAALRRLEGLVGGARRQGRRTELRAPARALAASDAALRRPRVLAAGRGGAHALPGHDGRRCGVGGRAPGERGQLRRGVARALRARARPERAPRGGQRVPLPAVPRDHRPRRCISARAAARTPAVGARRAHRRRASDPEPAARRALALARGARRRDGRDRE